VNPHRYIQLFLCISGETSNVSQYYIIMNYVRKTNYKIYIIHYTHRNNSVKYIESETQFIIAKMLKRKKIKKNTPEHKTTDRRNNSTTIGSLWTTAVAYIKIVCLTSH
jgi:hypothetical protein